jgi:hypothetical protein
MKRVNYNGKMKRAADEVEKWAAKPEPWWYAVVLIIIVMVLSWLFARFVI